MSFGKIAADANNAASPNGSAAAPLFADPAASPSSAPAPTSDASSAGDVTILRLYGEVAEAKDDPAALFNMGWMYLNGVCDTPANRDKAYAYFFAASEAGHDAAPYHMAMLQLGVGASSTAEKKKTFGGLEQAVKNLELSASRGFALACFELGVLYATVKRGYAPVIASPKKGDTPASTPAKAAAASTASPKKAVPASPAKTPAKTPGGAEPATPAAAVPEFSIVPDDAVARSWFEKAAAGGVEMATRRLEKMK